MGGELLVGVGESLELLVNELLVKGVEEDLFLAASVSADLGGSAIDTTGSNDVFKNGGVHGLKGSRTGSHLGWVVDG